MTFILPLAIAGLAFTACGPRITNANIAVVNKEFELAEKLHKGGVSPKEVESILGQPQQSKTVSIPLETQKKEVEMVSYFYKQDDQIIELHFLDNKLISRVPDFGAKPEVKTQTPPTKSTP